MSRSGVGPFAAIFCAAFGLARFTSAQESDFTVLRPTDGSPTALFGLSVDIAGEYCAVGAPGMHTSPESGVAFVFRRHGTDWLQEAKLTASDPISEDMFGYQIALAGDSVLVGAPGDSIDGEESGSAYVFRRDGRSWLSEARLIASDREDEGFGCAVAMESDYALVGAMRHSNRAQQAGAVYVFRRDGRHWIQEARLTASDAQPGAMFGCSIALRRDHVIIGAPAAEGSGAAYVFRREGREWLQEARLSVEDGALSRFFGFSVALLDDYAVVGAPGRAVYVFERKGRRWSEQARLAPDNNVALSGFGLSVDLTKRAIFVGACLENAGSESSGAVYTFRSVEGGWVQDDRRGPPAVRPLAHFGSAVSVGSSGLLVGAMGDDANGRAAGVAYLWTPGAED